MKIAVIGDRHGYDFGREWLEENINNTDINKFVFVGDWFDSFDKSLDDQIDVFLKDMSYKEQRPDDVYYLYGNHDVHYIFDKAVRCSGYQNTNRFKISNVLYKHISKIQHLCYFDGWLFSHAGVSNTLRNFFFDRFGPVTIEEFVEMGNISDNEAFYHCDNNGYGLYSGSMWIRPKQLFKDLIEGVNQCYGHTHISEPTIDIHENCKTLNVDAYKCVIIDTQTDKIEIV